MTLTTLPRKTVYAKHHALLVMKDDETSKVVCVVATDHSPSDIKKRLPLIEMVASRKLEHADLAFDGRVWVVPEDLPTAHTA